MITSEVSNTLSSSVTRTCVATCPNQHQQQVALYQWFSESDNVQGSGSKTSVATCYYQCRSGDLALNPPKCPAGACKDANCEECYPWEKAKELIPAAAHFPLPKVD